MPPRRKSAEAASKSRAASMSKCSVRGSSGSSGTGNKRKASASPTPGAKKTASTKKRRTRSSSPAAGRSVSKRRSLRTEDSKPAASSSQGSYSKKNLESVSNTAVHEVKVKKSAQTKSSPHTAKTPPNPKQSLPLKQQPQTSNQKAITLKQKAVTPKQKSAAQKSKITTPKDKFSPTKKVSTLKQKSTSKKKDSTAKQKYSTAKQKSPTAKQKSPTAKQKSPTAKQKSPTAKQKSATAKQKSPTAKQKSPTAKQKSSTAKQKSPTIKAKSHVKKTSSKVSPKKTESPSKTTRSKILEKDKEATENSDEKCEEVDLVCNVEKNDEKQTTEDDLEVVIIKKNELDKDAIVDRLDEKETIMDNAEERVGKNEETVVETSVEHSKRAMSMEHQDPENVENPESASFVNPTLVVSSCDEIKLGRTENNTNENEENGDEVHPDSANENLVEDQKTDVEIESQKDTEKNSVKTAMETDDSDNNVSEKQKAANRDKSEQILSEAAFIVTEQIQNVDAAIGGGDNQKIVREAVVQETEEISDDDVEIIGLLQHNDVECTTQGNNLNNQAEQEISDSVHESVMNGGCDSQRKQKFDEMEALDEVSSTKKPKIQDYDQTLENGSASENNEADIVIVKICDVPASDSEDVKSCLPNVNKIDHNHIQELKDTESPIYSRSFIPNPTYTDTDSVKQFSLVSYNILADCHLFRNDYSFTKMEYLKSENRLPKIIDELQYLDGDVVCLQEVDPTFYSDKLCPAMCRLGYEGLYKQRHGEYYNEGEASFYKTSRFTLVESSLHRLSDLIEKELIDTVKPDIRAAVRAYLDLADIVIVMKLQCHNTSQEVTIGNVHVHWGEMKVPDVQCVQIASAVKELVSRANGENFPHVICGDFNSPPMSPGYLVARDGYPSGDETLNKLMKIQGLELTDKKRAALVDSLWPAFQHTSSSLRSVYSEVQGVEPDITSYNKVMCECVDYIFYSSSSLCNVGVLQVPTKEKIMETGGTPNCHFPSDHVSIKAMLAFK